MRSKKKVLMLGNSEIAVLGFRKELVEELVAHGREVYVSFPQTEFGDGYGAAERYGCTYIPVEIDSHGTNPVTDFLLILAFRKIIRDVQPDIVFSYTIKPNIYGGMAAASCGVPYVMNISGLGIAVENPGLLQRITLMLYRFAVQKAQRVYFQNQENEQFFASRHIADGKREILPGSGVNLERFPLLPYPDDETVHFLFMARIMKEKGIDQYLEAAEAIRKKHPNTVFHVLGICAEEIYKKRLVMQEEAGTVRYHGHQEDMLVFQRISSCTIHPTYYPEGMSNVLLESAACGRPIITTERSGCREVLDDGVNGFAVRQKDAADLLEKLEAFLSLSWEERRAMGLAGRAKVERIFDRQIVVQKYLEELEAGGICV